MHSTFRNTIAPQRVQLSQFHDRSPLAGSGEPMRSHPCLNEARADRIYADVRLLQLESTRLRHTVHTATVSVFHHSANWLLDLRRFTGAVWIFF